MKSLITAFVFFAAIPVFSQHEIRFERITVEDGLSQSAIKSLVQDKYGYLWVGTLDGLNKYDGNKFYIFQHDDKDQSSIPRNDVHMLFIDKFQNLWLSTSGFLSRFVPEQNGFINYPAIVEGKSDPYFVVHDLYQKSDSVLILTSNTGIWEFNSVTARFSRRKDPSEFDGGAVQNYCEATDKSTWVVTRNSVYKREPNAKEFVKMLNHESNVSFLYSERTKEIYVQTREALYKFNHELNQFVACYYFPADEDVDEAHMRMLKLTNGELWVMRKKVIVFDSADHFSKTLRYIPQDPFTLSSDFLACIFETKDGVVWIGSNGLGLNKYSPQLSVFNYFGSFAGAPITLANNFVTAVVTDDDNELYVSTLDGLDVINLRLNKTDHYNVISKNGQKSRINKLLRNSAGELWIATSKGLRKWDGRKILFTGIPSLDDPTTLVNDLLFISSNELLIATTKGISVVNTQTNKIKKVSETGTLTMKLINNILWTERFASIVLLDVKTFEPIHDFKNHAADTSSFPDVMIKCFYQDSEGKIWIGTSGGGLTLYDEKKSQFRTFTEKHGLPNTVVYGILEDKAGNLWLSTNKGIAVFSKKEWRCIRNFNTSHGLQGNEFNTNAYHQSPSGKMYFGGVGGLTAFRPEEALSIKSEIPQCIIAGLFIDGDRVQQTEKEQSLGQIIDERKMDLTWNERNFALEISSLGFSYPAYTSYQYRLQGYDESWTFIENERRIQFTNIPPGSYTLHVKASNSFGEWEKDGLVLEINIKAPFWRTYWFVSLAIGVILFSMYSIYLWRTHFLRNRTRQLTELVNERTRTLQIQQEEIAAQNEELSAQSESMELRNAELENIKTTLEQRVEERTIVFQKLNEELINQNTQLEQFAFITAHNIRGPVARIKGLVNLLHTGDKNLIDLLTASINNLDEVISDLSSVLSIRKGLGNLAERVELKSQLQLTVKMLTDEILKVGGHVDISQFEKVYIDGLRPYVHSIFYNLIHNALKYSSSNRPVYISCSNRILDGRVKIVVKDNGVGIDMRYAKDKIFGLYQRFHPQIAGKGFGLFLTLTQVEAMGGTISVESVLDEGTQFTIDFPLSKDKS